MLRVVHQLRVFIYSHNLPKHLSKAAVEYEKENRILLKNGREMLMQMLHDTVLTDLDPDYAWYDTEISFDNGREVSILCKPGTRGNHDKLFELDGIGHLSFEEVGELLRNI